MRRIRYLIMCSLLLPPGLGVAKGLGEVEIEGLRGELLDNVRKSISLMRVTDAQRKSMSEARLMYLLGRLPEEVDVALQPYGYYGSSVETVVGDSVNQPTVKIIVNRGEAVRVNSLDVTLDGPAEHDDAVLAVANDFKPNVGAVMDHRVYESSKLAMQRVLLSQGYFSAEMKTHRVEVSRQTREAHIDMEWNTGARYRFGETTIEGSHIRESILYKTVQYEEGDYFDQDKLLNLHQRLTSLDYFGFVDVRPDLEKAENDVVPVAISLVPGKRTIYTAGFSVGTDSGVGVQLGMDRRWINDRGHKFSTNLDWAQRRQNLAAEYRIPAFAHAEGWYAFGASRRDEESDVLKTRITELVASRTGHFHGWDMGLAMHLRNEKYELGDEASRREGTAQVGESRLVYPAFSATKRQSDHPLFPTRGFMLRGEFKLGAEALASDVNFGQFLFDTALIRSVGESNRFIFRGQLGRTFTNEFDLLPPSLRFYAGGDRSIRGYGYQEVGPREAGLAIGGKNLLVGSAEYERMFTPSWGAAVFVDAGNAFNEVNEGAKVGAGLGLRWRSPVGMVRVDIAHGFDEAENAVQLHINIGSDL